LFPNEQKGFKAAIRGILGNKLGLKKGERLDLKIGRLTEYDYNCVDVFSKAKLVGEIRKSEIDEMIEKGAFEAAHYAGYIDGVPQITLTCLETHEYGEKPEYKAWRAKLKKEAAAEKEAREKEFPNELKRMINDLSKISEPVKKHFQFQNIVDQTYHRRKNPEIRKVCKDIGLKHISAFDDIAPHLKKEFSGTLPQIITFKHLPTILSEDGDHDQAIGICKKAISYKLKDGTKGGFQARIKRIEKKRDSALKRKLSKKP
jgi:hypothetical protein